MNKECDEKFLQDIVESLDRMDKEIRVETPGIDKLRMLVDRVEDKRKKKNDIQFLTFMILASFAVSFEVLALSWLSFNIFVIIQGIALICFPVALLIRRSIKHRQVEGL